MSPLAPIIILVVFQQPARHGAARHGAARHGAARLWVDLCAAAGRVRRAAGAALAEARNSVRRAARESTALRIAALGVGCAALSPDDERSGLIFVGALITAALELGALDWLQRWVGKTQPPPRSKWRWIVIVLYAIACSMWPAWVLPQALVWRPVTV
jgi:hypothetical protein